MVIRCDNQEPTTAEVIADFRGERAEALVVVADDDSTEPSVAVAAEAGAAGPNEPRQGKGYVVESMPGRVDAEVEVMAGGDEYLCGRGRPGPLADLPPVVEYHAFDVARRGQRESG